MICNASQDGWFMPPLLLFHYGSVYGYFGHEVRIPVCELPRVMEQTIPKKCFHSELSFCKKNMNSDINISLNCHWPDSHFDPLNGKSTGVIGFCIVVLAHWHGLLGACVFFYHCKSNISCENSKTWAEGHRSSNEKLRFSRQTVVLWFWPPIVMALGWCALAVLEMASTSHTVPFSELLALLITMGLV